MKISDRMIAQSIVLAQVASDGGKGITEIRNICKNSRKVNDWGYEVKDFYILKAIKMILASKNSGFRFFVSNDDFTPIVYFEYRGLVERENVVLQVSFHTFDRAFLKYANKRKYHGRWDEGSSRGTCMDLAYLFKL